MSVTRYDGKLNSGTKAQIYVGAVVDYTTGRLTIGDSYDKVSGKWSLSSLDYINNSYVPPINGSAFPINRVNPNGKPINIYYLNMSISDKQLQSSVTSTDWINPPISTWDADGAFLSTNKTSKPDRAAPALGARDWAVVKVYDNTITDVIIIKNVGVGDAQYDH